MASHSHCLDDYRLQDLEHSDVAAESSPSGTCFAFDLDGTITSEELLPLIASELNLEAEMSLLTRLTMDGVIPFEDSFRLRFAILRAAGLERVQSIVSEVRLDPYIVDFIRENRSRSFVVTGNLDLWIAPLADKLGCEFFASTAVMQAGKIAGIHQIMRKSAPALKLKDQFERLVVVGDGFNDIPMFDVADVGVAYQGVHTAPDALISVSNYVALDGKSLCRLLRTL
ncbi:HAD family phosphatase [Rhizobium sp. CFBP 8752]|uniref:HAD-IB family phosphatase n=1 Tax=Rhizobium sp. CFBP 8752 TaxID=2775301 RepID=UPI000DDEF9E8|nr:HAD-IB family phosphatase [Rhizobium sp. CFBP 8752]MBD8664238.1 HAD family phosphatase [Rhizobium sp. CFBP 8752]